MLFLVFLQAIILLAISFGGIGPLRISVIIITWLPFLPCCKHVASTSTAPLLSRGLIFQVYVFFNIFGFVMPKYQDKKQVLIRRSGALNDRTFGSAEY